MAGSLDGKRILILATNGFEQSELEVPRDKLKAAGAHVDVVSPEAGEIKGWDKKDWGRPVKVDKPLSGAKADDYDAIVLPGGQINPDLLRVNSDALALIKAFFLAGKTVAAVCRAVAADRDRHRQGPQDNLLQVDQDGRDERRREMENCAVVVDNGVITSRNPGDLGAFTAKIIEEIKEGRHLRRAA